MGNECTIKLPKFHQKQQLFFDSPASEILFAGDTRAGKSFAIRKSYIIWCSRIPGLLCDIFRVNFDDVIRNYMEGETSFPVLLAEWESGGLCTINQTEIIFWNESRISLEHCADDKVMKKHQGVAKHVRTLEESTQMPEHRIRALSGWVTMSELMKSRVPPEWKGRFPKLIHATNPVGESKLYYRKHFVDARPPMSIAQVGQFKRQYIPAFVYDNPSEDETATRARIGEAFTDVAVQDSLISKDPLGIKNWHTSTGEFFIEWDEDRHVVVNFKPPSHWFRYRTFDWGTAEPAYCAWIAVSDGEPFSDDQGRQRWFPRGAIIVYDEWYIADPKEPAKGLRMRNGDMARGIVDRSDVNFQHCVTLTDSKPFQDTGGDGPAAEFQRNDCPLTRADTSRVAGWSQMRGRLIGIEFDSNNPVRVPMLYVTEQCMAARRYIPLLQRHPSEKKTEDAFEHGEATHTCDAIRYACMAHNNAVIKDHMQPMQTRIQQAIEQNKPTMQKMLKRRGYGYFN